MKDESQLTPLESLFQDLTPDRDECPRPDAVQNAAAGQPYVLAGMATLAAAAGTAPKSDSPDEIAGMLAEVDRADNADKPPSPQSNAIPAALAAEALDMLEAIQAARPASQPAGEPVDREAVSSPETMASKAAAEDDKPYEALVRELEQIVRRLESGDITLDQSMALFARGIELTRRCQDQLDAIEKKITILIENPDGSITERPFADDGNE